MYVLNHFVLRFPPLFWDWLFFWLETLYNEEHTSATNHRSIQSSPQSSNTVSNESEPTPVTAVFTWALLFSDRSHLRYPSLISHTVSVDVKHDERRSLRSPKPVCSRLSHCTGQFHLKSNLLVSASHHGKYRPRFQILWSGQRRPYSWD